MHAAEPFETRLTRLMDDHPELTRDFLRFIEGKGGGSHAGREMFNILTHPGLLDLMECLVGPEIVGSSVYRIRPKVPGLDHGVVPWHQDLGYFAPHCDGSLIVTYWLPLVDATPENGCLQVLPRAHRAGVSRHCTGGPGGYLVIPGEELPLPAEEAVTVPVPLGGVLLLTNLTPHCSRPTRPTLSGGALDLRYQGHNVPTNAFQEPAQFDPAAPTVEVACYPPEGDFIVRSRQRPQSVHTYEQFAARRSAYENSRLPAPEAGLAALSARINTMPSLSHEQIRQYKAQSYLLVSGLIPDEVAAAAEDAIWRAIGSRSDDPASWPEGAAAHHVSECPELLACYTPEMLEAASRLADEPGAEILAPKRAYAINVFPMAGEWTWPRPHIDHAIKEHGYKTFPRAFRVAAMTYLSDVPVHGGGTVVSARLSIR